MVTSDKADAPGAYIKNKEHPHSTRSAAGMLFFDDEGTEDGGLIYGVTKDQAGNLASSNVHLSFDKYMQDQVFTVDAGQYGGDEFSTLTMQDRGNYSIRDALDASNRIEKLPEAQREAEWRSLRPNTQGITPEWFSVGRAMADLCFG